jgi:hypothetical protein
VKPSTETSAVEKAAPVLKKRIWSAAAKKQVGDASRKRWKELRKAKQKNSEVPF